ncbi:hypothetical protein AMJ40_01925 [candidate division TA06 bacterium DG_26]|uniref:Uncharacterized protein n=1 Tax=candidate division TA06 bacterium DG_26 TaxID=1703771 RepID=A0A0S7WKR2_UNCT6|nr:MAG: hypothetical protein AMJ40_01925 [candidate division TA06 bacterium DG_26]
MSGDIRSIPAKEGVLQAHRGQLRNPGARLNLHPGDLCSAQRANPGLRAWGGSAGVAVIELVALTNPVCFLP